MAFFSNSKQSDLQLRRKRSTSTNRDRPSRQSTDTKSTEETSFHKRSPTMSASPSTSAISPEPHCDPAPPLPTPVTVGLGFRSRTAGARNVSPSSYDQSSTPIPFTKPNKRASPPPFSSLMINVPIPHSVDSSSPRATVHYPDEWSKSNSRTSPSSPSPSSLVPNFGPVKHAAVPPEDLYSGLISPSMPRVERQRSPFSQRIAAVLPLKLPHSPTLTPNSETEPIALPTPISPPQGRNASRPEPIPIPPPSPLGRPHSRSQSATNSPTAYAPGSGSGSTKSSARRFPALMGDIKNGPGSASPSGKSTSSHEAVPNKPREKRPRNVLRKRSITDGTRRREAESCPASDSEKKTNAHRPRSRSVVFPRRRDSSGPLLDDSQPLPAIPVAVVDLTPAKEILVAYKESHRDSFSRDTPLRNSGRTVAIGSGEDITTSSLASPLSPGSRSGRKEEGKAEKRNAAEKSGAGIRSLKRKISGKWSGKEPSRRRDDPTRSISESAAEVSARKLTRDTEAIRCATFSNDTRPSPSPASRQSPVPERWPDHDGGRVWEEEVGNWASKHLRDTETEEKDVSNSRRLWNLVKRLSSGNLREKASPPFESAPPVPPLPKDISRKRDISPIEAHGIHASEMPIPQSAVPETPGGIRRFIISVPSLSIPRSEPVSVPGAKQTNIHYHRSDPDSGASVSPIPMRMNAAHRSGTTGTPPPMRRAATTRSSSPSSETTKFFSRSRSSSSSSYGDVMAPPMPSILSAHAGNHTPSPQHPSSHNDQSEDTVGMGHSPSAKTSTPPSPRTSDEASQASPTIPPFEAHHPVNRFLPYRGRRPPLLPSTTSWFPGDKPTTLHTEQAQLTNPPPIPTRNPRRPGHHSLSIPSLPAQQRSQPSVIAVDDLSESEVADGSALLPLKRPLKSGQTPIIPKPRPRSISTEAITPEPERSANTAKTSLTFREMTTTQRQLTEQEKNAKWEDLLQRSDKAGGTLHVGSPIGIGGLGLWSDRSSVALSVAPSEALDSIE